MKTFSLTWIWAMVFTFLLDQYPVQAQADSLPSPEIWLLANTADIPAESGFYPALRLELEKREHPVHLLINGDIIGSCKDKHPSINTIEPLLKTVEGLAHVQMTILPGDRDWNNSGKGGLKCVKELNQVISSYKLPNVHWPLRKGCPGPEVVALSDQVVLIAINSQWWNHPYDKPLPADADCKVTTEYEILEEIEDAIEDHKNKTVLLAGHYPIYSLGKYGGRFPLKDHLLPPVYGSLKVAYHQYVGNAKDISNERFRKIANPLRSLSYNHEGLIYVSGHEQNQQVIFFNGNYMINSGAPVRGRFAAKQRSALLSSQEAGFISLGGSPFGEMNYHFYHFEQQSFRKIQSGRLSPNGSHPSPDVHHSFPSQINIEQPTQSAVDSFQQAAGAQYQAGGIKTFFFGKHYRSTWTTPVTNPLLSMDTLYGGLTILGRGGGRQTKSLKLQAANGRQYVFRSVDKDPVGALDYSLRNTLVATVTRDQTSTQHPYGAIAVADLLDHLDILHATPTLYRMPDHPSLQEFRSSFSGMMGMLEERPHNPDGEAPVFGQADQIYKSYKLFRALYDDHDHQLERQEYARARLFDILIGDWSKHEDNWKWAAYKKNAGMMFRPIPRDRDHAFSNLDGLLPYLADREWAIPNIEHFGAKAK